MQYYITGNHNQCKKNDNLIPSCYELGQNYPNPFNPVTVIKFSIPVSGFVCVKIFDILGKVVSVPLNEYKSSGNYSVNFDAGNLSSGIYFYKLFVNDFTFVKKMTLLK